MFILGRELIDRVVVCCPESELKDVIKDYKSKGYLFVDTADIKYKSSGKVLTFELIRVVPTNEMLESYHW